MCSPGKTELLKTIGAYARTYGHAICSATTGLASLNQPNGSTAHASYGIPVLDPDDQTVLSSVVDPRSSRGQLLGKAILHTWDEVAAAHVSVFHAVLRVLRHIQLTTAPDNNSTNVVPAVVHPDDVGPQPLPPSTPEDQELLPTTGVFVTAGDFRQTAPVVIYGDEASIIQASIRASPIFQKYFKTFRLTKLVRQSQDPEYGAAVMDIGNGAVAEDDDGLIPLPYNDAVTDVEAVREFLFPDSILTDPGAQGILGPFTL